MTSEETLVQRLLRHADEGPREPAFVVSDRRVVRAELAAAIRASARRLEHAGVRAGDRVALLGSNCPEFAVAYFAVHALAAVAVPLPVTAPPAALEASLEQVTPRVVLHGPTPLPGGLPLAELATLEDPSAEDDFEPRSGWDDPADLLFTTGTSGHKKAVLLDQGAIACAARNISGVLATTADDLEVVPIPLSHSFGLGRLRCLAWVGNSMVLEEGLKNPARLLKSMKELRATGLAMVPAGLALLRRFVKAKLRDVAEHLRYLEIGSARLAEPERDWLLEHLPNTRIWHHYGLTEASRSTFCDVRRDRSRRGTIGRPTPGMELGVFAETGEAQPVGQPGEIRVRGRALMREYWGQPDRTASAWVDGWFRTGDEGRVDQDGYVYLLGRREDIISVGGLKVSPAEVEEEILRDPSVAEAACIGIPDPSGVAGQRVKAFVVADDDFSAKHLLASLRERLEEFAVPAEFERVASLPRTSSGKLLRHKLREPDPS